METEGRRNGDDDPRLGDRESERVFIEVLESTWSRKDGFGTSSTFPRLGGTFFSFFFFFCPVLFVDLVLADFLDSC